MNVSWGHWYLEWEDPKILSNKIVLNTKEKRKTISIDIESWKTVWKEQQYHNQKQTSLWNNNTQHTVYKINQVLLQHNTI